MRTRKERITSCRNVSDKSGDSKKGTPSLFFVAILFRKSARVSRKIKKVTHGIINDIVQMIGTK